MEAVLEYNKNTKENGNYGNKTYWTINICSGMKINEENKCKTDSYGFFS